MVFSSMVFLFIFLPVFLLAYYLTPSRFRNFTALLASVFFYAWGAPRLVFLLLVSCVFDFAVSGKLPPDSAPAARRKGWLTLAVAVNMAGLLYFKYANFFVQEVNRLLGALGIEHSSWVEVALPIGISFFTFQKISYLVDVYRGTAGRAESLVNYTLYVTLFPQLIAGPIVRYHDVAAQLVARNHTAEKMMAGIWRFSQGLAKKVLIANVMGQVADAAFAMQPGSLAFGTAWIGVLCYSFQIYFDFSGYSDMAIGLGRMMGLEFLENFNRPYIAHNFTEFWRRWHMSLSNWMREYLYLPLGGNRRGKARTYLNLWLVFLFSGFWHGAAWNFVVWGAFHGFFMSLDKAVSKTRLSRIPPWLAIPATFLLVQFSWVLFRAPHLSEALKYMAAMLSPSMEALSSPVNWSQFFDPHARFVFLVAMLIVFIPAFFKKTASPDVEIKRTAPSPGRMLLTYALSLVLLILSASALAASRFNPFIYFRF